MLESFFGGVLVLSGAYFLYHAFAMRSKLERAQQWPSVLGTITESKVKRGSGKRPTHRAKIRYRYEVNGREHQSKSVVIGGETSGGRAGAEARCAKYPKGSRHTVYYDPANPSDACLERVREGGAAEIIGGIVGILLGAALLLGMVGPGGP